MKNILDKIKKNTFGISLVAAMSAFIATLIFFAISGMAPFGDDSLVCYDAYYQYLDFFCYLKDVLSGKNSIGFSLTNMLGGSSYALFAYYLASPFNLIIIFFKKTQIIAFFDILVACKLSMCAFSMSYFVNKRFKEKVTPLLTILLAYSYAFMQYNLAQCSNIMWLDGVYMLPFILLGVYKLVSEKKWQGLSVAVGLSIIFNWYSAGINCLMSGLWFVMEILLHYADKYQVTVNNSNRDIPIKENYSDSALIASNTKSSIISSTTKYISTYIMSMLIGIMLSAFLFIPSTIQLSGGKGNFDFDLFENIFHGEFSSIFLNNALGSTSSLGHPTLFCGSLIVVGCIGFLCAKNISIREKMVMTSATFIIALSMFWQPLILIFSLLKMPKSYYYRYSYIACFMVIFIAAFFFSRCEKKNITVVAILTFMYIIVIFFANELNEFHAKTDLNITLINVIVFSILYYLNTKKEITNTIALVIIFILAISELLLNFDRQIKINNIDESAFSAYNSNTESQINAIKGGDNGIYRVTQTATRTINPYIPTANYNEGLAFNYNSISGYSSCFDASQTHFLSNNGYRIEDETILITGTSILGIDSLLGVKYVMSPYSINGLIECNNIDIYNNKTTYLNPFAYPIAFKYPSDDIIVSDSIKVSDNINISDNIMPSDRINPFEYQNNLFNQISVIDDMLYLELEYECNSCSDGTSYTIKIPDGNYCIYGSIPYNTINNDGFIILPNGQKLMYGCFNSPDVFYIPYNGDSDTITISANNILTDGNAYFYALDLDTLAILSQAAQENAASNLVISHNKISCNIEATEGEKLLITIPYNKGFSISLNGEKITADLFADCLISIPLTNGNNIIKISYTIPGLRLGIVLTLLATIITVLSLTLKAKSKSKTDLL